MAYTFDGQNRIISVDVAPVGGAMTLYAKEMYAYWKLWVLSGDGAGYYEAFRSSGGDFTEEDQTRGSWYFFVKNWRFKFYEADHRCVILGNIKVTSDATEDDAPGGSPFVFPVGYSVHVETEFSTQSLKQLFSTGSGLSEEEHNAVINTNSTVETIETKVDTVDSVVDGIDTKVDAIPTTGSLTAEQEAELFRKKIIVGGKIIV
jgi:hypothetical protein